MCEGIDFIWCGCKKANEFRELKNKPKLKKKELIREFEEIAGFRNSSLNRVEYRPPHKRFGSQINEDSRSVRIHGFFLQLSAFPNVYWKKP